MKISVFGIGYVGAVSAACLAKDGHSVICVDPNEQKVASIMEKRSPILEPGLEDIIAAAVDDGDLLAMSDPLQAVLGTDLSLVCVGTPSRFNGSLDTGYVIRAAEEIGKAIARKGAFHICVFRSTILPGTMSSLVIPALERASGLTAGVDFGVAYYPEFLRESTAIADYYDPGVIVFGALDGDKRSIDALVGMCAHLPVEPKIVSLSAAEAVKYANNAWHATKISFANEIGNICKASKVDSFEVMDVLCADYRLNISPAYLKPGFAFGGSCLPKDLRAIRYKARQLDVPTPVLDATLAANEYQLAKAYNMVVDSKLRRVGIVGLSFKSNTDDLRESPLVELAERLHGKGYDIRIYDPNVTYGSLTGANLNFVRSHIPHLSDLLVERPEELVEHSEVIVLGKKDKAVQKQIAGGGRTIIDLVGIAEMKSPEAAYDGICW